MKRLLFFLLGMGVLFCSARMFAMPVDSVGTLVREGKQYIRHEVAAGETWYAIARTYGVSFSALKVANRGSADLLKTGQILLVPVSKSIKTKEKKHDIEPVPNTPDRQAEPKKSVVEKTHVVSAGETLFRIAGKYDVTVDDLKKWNRLTGNTVSKGQRLRILQEGSVPPNVNPRPAGETIVPETPAVDKPVITNAPVPITPSPEPRRENGGAPIPPTEVRSAQEPAYVFTNGRKKVTEQGVAGWVGDQDINPNRYFALHRTAPNGTIIRVTNRMNNRSVFVKVVGRLPDAGDNDDIIIKISKAAADKMGVIDQRFQVDLLYGVQEK